MSDTPTQQSTPPVDIGISKAAIRLSRFVDRLPKEGRFIIVLVKEKGEWKIEITEVKVEKVFREMEDGAV